MIQKQQDRCSPGVTTSLNVFSNTRQEEWGKIVSICDEHYTSKCCCKCGNIKWNLRRSKSYKCDKCGNKCDRDHNGSKNILAKFLMDNNY